MPGLNMAEIPVVLLGAGAVGKSCLALHLVQGQFIERYDAPIEVVYRQRMEVDGADYVLTIVDTAGQDAFGTMQESYLKKGSAFVLVYDITNAESFERVTELYSSHHRACDRAACVLVANKSDLADRRVVSIDDGRRFAAAIECPFLEISSKDHKAVMEVFTTLVRTFVRSAANGNNAPDVIRFVEFHSSICDDFADACGHLIDRDIPTDELIDALATVADELHCLHRGCDLDDDRDAAGTDKLFDRVIALAGVVSELRSHLYLSPSCRVPRGASMPAPSGSENDFSIVLTKQVLWLRSVTLPPSETLPAGFLSRFAREDVEKLVLPRSLVHIESGFLMEVVCPKLSVQFSDHLETIGDAVLAGATIDSVSVKGNMIIGDDFAHEASCGSVVFEAAPTSATPTGAIGDNFFASSTVVSILDLRQANFTKIGKNFAAKSEVTEVRFSGTVQRVEKLLCDGCALSTEIFMMPRAFSNHLACLMNILSDTDRLEALTQFTRMWPTAVIGPT